jgi:hypothetical protein
METERCCNRIVGYVQNVNHVPPEHKPMHFPCYIFVTYVTHILNASKTNLEMKAARCNDRGTLPLVSLSPDRKTFTKRVNQQASLDFIFSMTFIEILFAPVHIL